jgi:hypothetical protein
MDVEPVELVYDPAGHKVQAEAPAKKARNETRAGEARISVDVKHPRLPFDVKYLLVCQVRDRIG